ncbi:MAG: hypothetical protein HY017_30705 [Betaproteobacteria bacterium]|nr:hypothetical protein [Betaproteobacteria bacterium]
MRRTLLDTSIVAASALPPVSYAEATAGAAPASPHTFTGNVGLFSTYRFRGIDQTFGKPALQGGIDYGQASGLYLGNWISNVSSGAGYPGGNLEMDFYGGWRNTWGDWGLDVGALYYYPGTNSGTAIAFSPANNRTGSVATGRVDNTELYIGGSWKFMSLKYSQAVGDYFSTPGTKNSNYLDFGATHDFGDGWGINGHIGRLSFRNMTNGGYNDWKVGVTKDISGWVLAASYIDTNANGNCSPTAVLQVYCFANGNGTSTKDAGRSTLVLSISNTF